MPNTHVCADGRVYYKGHRRAPNKDHLIALSHERHAKHLKSIRPVGGFPSSFDSRAVSPACIPELEETDDDQAQCGSCWCFSGVEMVEVALMLAGVLGLTQRLSKQYILSCGQNGGCNGDDNTTPLKDAKAKGIPLTSDYGPYRGSAGSCAWKSGMKLYQIDDYIFADGNGGNGVTPADDIKTVLVKYRFVGCAVAAGGGWWDNGQGVDTGNSSEIDHDVGIAAWDDSKGVTTGAMDPALCGVRASQTTCWLMRNSWGPKWGVGGYGWVKEGADQLGTESVVAVKASVVPPNPWGNLSPAHRSQLAAIMAQLLPSDIKTESLAGIDKALANTLVRWSMSAAELALLQAWRATINSADPNGDLMQQVLSNLS